jgi:hypothetical protein
VRCDDTAETKRRASFAYVNMMIRAAIVSPKGRLRFFDTVARVANM